MQIDFSLFVQVRKYDYPYLCVYDHNIMLVSYHLHVGVPRFLNISFFYRNRSKSPPPKKVFTCQYIFYTSKLMLGSQNCDKLV